MTKNPDPKHGSGSGRKPVRVLDPSGKTHPFLRGMVTHDLVQRGLPFDDAYAVAHALRDRLSNREEVSTSELKDVLDEQLEEMFGAEVVRQLGLPVVPPVGPVVVYDGRDQPFSRGLLARSIFAAGMDFDRAYRRVSQVQEELREEGVARIASDDLVRRVGNLLEREDGAAASSRYRLMRNIRRLPKPVVFYLAGASGTGKSTLALELAPLLRIFRINATDTIRQVMRMVFSSAILPALHRSSFELDADDLVRDEAEGRERDERRVVDAFEEQALRVLVGVRGVVERSVAENTSLLVEGVHLVPPLIPFLDLEGSAYQVTLLLAILDEEVHRSRFLLRGPQGGRRAERYLRGFPAIRSIQEYLLQQAETYDVPIIDTSDQETPLPRTLRVLSGVLEKQVPSLASSGKIRRTVPIPSLLLIVDGMPDRPLRALNGRTPLQAAKTPNLDRLAREGVCGLADPVAPEVVPDTAAGTLALFGQSPLAIKRGPVEALGAGLRMQPGDVALRGNFASLDKAGVVFDRRAGRIREETEELAEALREITLRGEAAKDVEVLVQASTEHRLALVLRGSNLASAISGSDPGDGAVPARPLTPKADDPNNPSAVRTARVLALFEEEARRVLSNHPVNRRRRRKGRSPANCVLTRGAGRIHQLVPLEMAGRPLRITCVSGDGTVLGIASWVGARTVQAEGMTANLDTDLRAKFREGLESLGHQDLVVVHVKGADIAAHDTRPDLKVAFLERVDQELGWVLDHHEGPLRVAVASDHSTLSESGQHSADPVPVVLWGDGLVADAVERFDERAVAAGGLHRFPLQLLLPRLFDG